jgi:hypothetical protein
MPLITIDSRLLIIVALVGVPSILSLAVDNARQQRASPSPDLMARADTQDQRARPSSRTHRSVAVDPRSLPSALPIHQRNNSATNPSEQLQAREQVVSMRVEGSQPSRRPAPEPVANQSVLRKRFKTSGRFSTTSSETSDLSRNINTLHGPRSHLNDLNNNSIDTQGARPTRRQNVSSINGTVDLSQYSQEDVDRLYGDALLVYFKNFNE